MTTEPETQEYPEYIIDVGWHKQNRRSLNALLRSRIRTLGGEQLEQKIRGSSDKGMFAALRKLNTKSDEFIPPDLPILEAVFRVFLTEGNRPMSPVDIRDRLMHWWRDVGAYKDVEPHILKRLLDHDNYYGFRQVS